MIGYGYSQAGTLVSRLATIYPEMFKAYFTGGYFKHVLPTDEYAYPYGVKDHEDFFGVTFDLEAFNQIAKLTQYGALDTNTPILDYQHNFNIFRELYGDFFNDSSVTPQSVFIDGANFFHEYGGEGMFYVNQVVRHDVLENDITLITNFFRSNINSEGPVYPDTSPFIEHLIINRD